MKTRWKISLAAVAFLGLSLGVSLLTLHMGSENELAAYKKTLSDQGVKLHISEVLPPPVPADQNGADLVEAALKLLPGGPIGSSNEPPMMQMIAPGKAMVGWQQPQIIDTGKDGYTNSWDNAALAMEAARPAVEILQQAADFPALDFHLEYQKGPGTPLQHLTPMLKGARYLSEMADCELHGGDPKMAVTNLCALLSLVRGLQDERAIFSQNMRFNMSTMAFEGTWEMLQTTNVSDADLTRLQKSWEQLKFIDALVGALLMDEAMVDEALIKMGKTPAGYRAWGYAPAYRSTTGDPWEDAKRVAGNIILAGREKGTEIMWQTSYKDLVELRFLKDAQNILEAVHQINTNQFFQPAYSNLTSRLELADKVTRFDVFAGHMVDARLAWASTSLSKQRLGVVHLAMQAEVSRRMAITAIALKRFQMKCGKFPGTSAELTPEFLTTIPLDAVNGQPLHYYRNSDAAFSLYSVGENGVDDGGDPTAPTGTGSVQFYWLQADARDWVWPQPATQAEIEKYYADEAAKK